MDLVARGPTCHTYLWLVTTSPAGACGLAAGRVEKGLPGRGLREAWLEQEDRREDWLSVCVLLEPCGERGLEGRGREEQGRGPPITSGWGSPSRRHRPTWKLVASTSGELSPLVCPGEAA